MQLTSFKNWGWAKFFGWPPITFRPQPELIPALVLTLASLPLLADPAFGGATRALLGKPKNLRAGNPPPRLNQWDGHPARGQEGAWPEFR